MKISHVLLRWYKSFNINYYGYDDRRHGVQHRPWNGIGLSGDTHSYRFVEIPIQDSITTIVGANESGKSHLLSAISKVIRGNGIPDDRQESRFDVTDLCHYSSVKDKNAEVWPNIGLGFSGCTDNEIQVLLTALGKSNTARTDHFTLVLAPEGNTAAWLYMGDEANPIALTREQLAETRRNLIPVEFIRSDVPLADEVIIDDILAQHSLPKSNGKTWYTFESAQAAARLLSSLLLPSDKVVPSEVLATITTAQGKLSSRKDGKSSADLETKLFCDVLGIKPATFERLARLDKNDRGYAEGLIAVWNEELDRVLNLSYYWQQDDRFTLRVNFKDGVFYFEITDKTGSVYTFRERSSGLRFFLSYYIQAKALEHKYRDRGCVILMDEPDSYLSIAAQKNLLSVFESLVSAASSTDKLQLIYTTHSPFLINKNYPNRIRLVRKGDSEEGTQFIDESRLRHYEPVRSALGIDCAQTLFMGETNVVLEGPSDQFLIVELNRLFVMYRDPASFLDLTSIVLMSAESATGVEKLLAASMWGDERIPATVVLFDGDGEGIEQQKRITGKGRKGDKQLIHPDFVLTVTEALGACDGQTIVTTEDLVPRSIYAAAVRQYLVRWFPDVIADVAKFQEIDPILQSPTYGAQGLIAATEAFFKSHVHPERDEYDKMGVFHEVMAIVTVAVRDKPEGAPCEAVAELESRMKRLCEELWRRIDKSRQATRRESAAQAIRRELDDFFKRFKKSAPAFDIVRILERVGREIAEIGEDGQQLRNVLAKLQHEIQQFRDGGNTMVEKDYWKRWSTAIWRVKKNPLHPDITEFEHLEIDESVFLPDVEPTTGDGDGKPAISSVRPADERLANSTPHVAATQTDTDK